MGKYTLDKKKCKNREDKRVVYFVKSGTLKIVTIK